MTKDIKIDLNQARGKRDGGYLTGQAIVAMPQIEDARFRRTVFVIYEHNEEGAKGFCLTRLNDKVTFLELARQLHINCQNPPEPLMHQGGPIDSMRGFVLHSADRKYRTSLQITNQLYLTSSIEPLNEIANHIGPKQRILLLGHMVWGAGELEREIEQSLWLHMECDADIVFMENVQAKWQAAMRHLNVNPAQLSLISGES